MITMIKDILHRLGWIRHGTGMLPSPSDDRDYEYNKIGYNKSSVDLRDKFASVTNQTWYNSCTASCSVWYVRLSFELQ